jgi:DNA-binding NarL/FixJ family response regulator
MTFLLVDADRLFREALAIGLRLDGHAVVTEAEPEGALRRLAGGGVDCCVVDSNVAGAEELLAFAALAGVRLVVTGVHASLLASAVQRHPTAVALPKPFRARELTAAR